MKIFYTISCIALALALSTACSLNKEEKAEIRFVDLQGNARPIKTRVPEANARIMAGQASGSITQDKISKGAMPKEIEREYNLNQKIIAENSTKYNRGAFDNNQSDKNPAPKFNDEDVYRKSTPRLMVENSAPTKNENPIIEYDLMEEKPDITKNNDKKTTSENTQKFLSENYDYEKNNDNKTNQEDKIITSKNNQVDNKEEFSGNNKSIFTSKSNKIVTYSSKNIKNLKEGNPEQLQSINSEENSDYIEQSKSSDNIETIDETNNKSYLQYSKKGKFYVQTGAFSNSQSAKNKIGEIKNFKNGKVFIGNKDDQRIYRAVYGPYKTRAQADKIKNRIKQSGIDAIVIRGK